MTIVGAGLALLVGFVLGLLGGGGSVLTLPILVYVLNVPVKPAIATSLCVVGLVALIGFLSHLRHGSVATKVAMYFGPFAVVASYVGARLSVYVPEQVQLIVFGIVGLAGSVFMLRGSRLEEPLEGTLARPDRRTKILLALRGIGVGLLTGIIGIGGGFLIVPALVIGARLPMRMAVGTSLFVIMMNALSGFVGHLGAVSIDWQLVAWFTALAAVGSIIGTFASQRVPQQRLRQVFGFLLIGVSVYILVRR